MNTRTRSGYQRFAALSNVEKERQWRELNDPASTQSFGPMPPRAKQAWERAKSKRGRPRIGAGSKRIQITVERKLLKDADTYATQHRLSRAQLVARGLRAVLSGAA